MDTRIVAVLTLILPAIQPLQAAAVQQGRGSVRIYADIDGPQGFVRGPDGAMWFTNFNSLGRITTGVTPGS